MFHNENLGILIYTEATKLASRNGRTSTEAYKYTNEIFKGLKRLNKYNPKELAKAKEWAHKRLKLHRRYWVAKWLADKNPIKGKKWK